MRNLILFDDEFRDALKPFTYTRPVSEIRLGAMTIREKWEHVLQTKASYITADYLAEKYPIVISDDNILINGAVLPNDRLLKLVNQLDLNEALLLEGQLIATRLRKDQIDLLVSSDFADEISGFQIKGTPLIKIQNKWDIFQYNRAAIEYDFQILTAGRQSQPISSTNRILSKDNVFLEEGAYVECAILNAQSGPIYVGKNATVMEGSILKGPVTVGESATVKMGAKIYGPTTVGPYCKAGGEIKRSVLFAHSNKSHDGYMGDSVIGEWCNLGADTNTSNLKNNYTEIKMWNYSLDTFEPTGHLFCGLMMGDHSKTGINTMINTGTVIGVSANVFGAGYPRTFIPSFSWGGNRGFQTFQIEKALETARTVIGRRGVPMTDTDENILREIFQSSTQYRHK
jgi:UDP-N-acetylglucosamine diphosphorylase/glucosamine-1-phosphate N-acetyltransferase